MKDADARRLEAGLDAFSTRVYVAVLPSVPAGFVNEARVRALAG